jgi:hypothetical protein
MSMRCTIFSISTMLIFLVSPHADTIHVPADQPTIQAGIDAAVDGDTVLVAPGTYVENIDFLGKAIIVMSSGEPIDTIIDGMNPANPDFGSVVTFSNREGTDSVLEGFTLQRGIGLRLEPFTRLGGGILIYQSSPTIINSIISQNCLNNGIGGGIFNMYGSPVLIDCTFQDNRADDNAYFCGGGGLYNEDGSPRLIRCSFEKNVGSACSSSDGSPVFIDCTFTGNEAFSGSGLNVYCGLGSLTLTRCTFADNSSYLRGGAIDLHAGSPAITDCIFYNNDAGELWGGGVYAGSGNPVLTNCTFMENRCGVSGGGLMNHGGDPILINCVISKNSSDQYGGGVNNEKGSMKLFNCTFFNNSAAVKGGGVSNFDAEGPTLTNCILWDDMPGEIYNDTGCSSDVTYCCVQGGWPGMGNIQTDPLFVEAINNDIHLTYNSPCHDAGDNSAVTESTDFEGDPRIAWGGTVDMGADEFYTHLYCTGDFTPGSAIEGKLVGLSGTSPVGMFLGSGILDPPVPTAWGSFHLQAPWLLIPLVPIPGDGVLVLPATIPATPPAPYDLPMQALIGLNPDSLSNLYVLEVR